ncbi:MAG: hypothetical protein ACRERV_04895, partial [Methylococcales bacterium]
HNYRQGFLGAPVVMRQGCSCHVPRKILLCLAMIDILGEIIRPKVFPVLLEAQNKKMWSCHGLL